MSTVIHIRDVPEDVRDALAQAARDGGLTLSAYVRHELQHLAIRDRAIRRNAAIVRSTQSAVAADIDRESILSTLDDGRPD